MVAQHGAGPLRHPAAAACCLAALGLTLAGCGDSSRPPPADARTPAAAPEPPPDRDLDIHVFVCEDGTQYAVAFGEEAALLLLPEGARRLPHVRSASGARFASDDGTELWNKGDEAMVSVDGVERRGCRSDPAAASWESARVRGVDYRAVGNEPGWHLEIVNGGRTRFVGDYGELVLEFDTPTPADGGGPGAVDYLWREGDRGVTIRLRREPCRDTMAGVGYPLRVRVEVDGRIFEGCGRALADGER
jgi:putative lipoprotein